VSGGRPGGPGKLDGRTIILTGGAGLLGREYARALAVEGALVVLADLETSGVDAVAAGLAAEGLHVEAIPTDVTDEGSVERLITRAGSHTGRIDGLVNNAAINPAFDGQNPGHGLTFEAFPIEMWQAALAVNLTGPLLCARAVTPYMRAQRAGAIVNVSSTYGLVGPDQRLYASDDPSGPPAFKPVTYSVTKSAMVGLTRYLATYFAGTGIRVNTLTPGGVFNDHPPDFVRRYEARTPMGRMAERHEYNAALVFLLSDDSSYMTGSNLVIDGGWTAW
jgi:2-deoxy-D-gluconate 3-dehydrogenase